MLANKMIINNCSLMFLIFFESKLIHETVDERSKPIGVGFCG